MQMEKYIFNAQQSFEHDYALLMDMINGKAHTQEEIIQKMILPKTRFTDIFIQKDVSFKEKVEQAKQHTEF